MNEIMIYDVKKGQSAEMTLLFQINPNRSMKAETPIVRNNGEIYDVSYLCRRSFFVQKSFEKIPAL
ncbi:hypothetical protein [Paenibacillus sp. V4I7]|uniref:hypothetical protein n=1 Tax=Paenibacillus sp. V4I7 TaxID=3042307 RepID=UPI0027808BB4|nr:hypothetical protein [Paenibacillus sp. V4I7]MDQ0901151.1 hypothetical protein [Paenibacillus sp. V4I7]